MRFTLWIVACEAPLRFSRFEFASRPLLLLIFLGLAYFVPQNPEVNIPHYNTNLFPVVKATSRRPFPIDNCLKEKRNSSKNKNNPLSLILLYIHSRIAGFFFNQISSFVHTLIPLFYFSWNILLIPTVFLIASPPQIVFTIIFKYELLSFQK